MYKRQLIWIHPPETGLRVGNGTESKADIVVIKSLLDIKGLLNDSELFDNQTQVVSLNSIPTFYLYVLLSFSTQAVGFFKCDTRCVSS